MCTLGALSYWRENLSGNISFMTSTSEVLSAISVISAGHYYHMRIVFLLSRRNEGNKGNLVTLTLRSHFCTFCYFCGTLLFHADSFYCPTEIKEIKEILLPSLCAALSAISAISSGRLLPHADSIYCPAVIGFAASLVEETSSCRIHCHNGSLSHPRGKPIALMSMDG